EVLGNTIAPPVSSQNVVELNAVVLKGGQVMIATNNITTTGSHGIALTQTTQLRQSNLTIVANSIAVSTTAGITLAAVLYAQTSYVTTATVLYLSNSVFVTYVSGVTNRICMFTGSYISNSTLAIYDNDIQSQSYT